MAWRTGAVAAVLVALGPGPARAVTLGAVWPGSGPDAAAGRELRAGVELALQDLRARGRAVDVRWEDDAGDPRAGLAAVARLAGRPEVAGVLSVSTSEATGPEAKAAEHFQVPLLVAAAEADELTRLRYRWTFRLGASAGDQAEGLLALARTLGRPRTIALLAERSEGGDSLLRCAHASAKGHGMRIVAEELVAPGADWGPALARAAAARPDVALLAATRADGRAVLAAARGAGLAPRALLAAGPSFEDRGAPASPVALAGTGAGAASAGAGPLPRGLLRVAPWSAEATGPAARAFAGRLAAQGRPVTARLAAAYAATVILAEEAALAAGDRLRLRDALERGRWEGVAGTVAFADLRGATHQNVPVVVVEQLQDGGPVPVWPREVARAAAVPFGGW